MYYEGVIGFLGFESVFDGEAGEEDALLYGEGVCLELGEDVEGEGDGRDGAEFVFDGDNRVCCFVLDFFAALLCGISEVLYCYEFFVLGDVEEESAFFGGEYFCGEFLGEAGSEFLGEELGECVDFLHAGEVEGGFHDV